MTFHPRACLCGFLFFVVLAVLLCGCGGGSNPMGGNGFGGSGAFAEQARTAALDAIAAQYDALPQTSATEDANALLAFIRTRSEFSVSGIARDNSVWARFTDGRPLVITLNDFSLKPGSKQASRYVLPRRSRSLSGEPKELPASNRVYLVNTREMGDTAVEQTFNQLENSYLPPNSYLPIVIEGTIEHLKVIQNAGVLYNIGHAGLGYKGVPRDDPGTPQYIFGTLTRRAPGSDATYAAELNDGEVGYLLEPTLKDRLTGAPLSRYTLASGYFITDVFVAKYWTFSANSLFISDNCDGSGDEAQSFIQACFNKGLSVYLSWDNAVVNADANESALFLFDRMLGNNDPNPARQPEKPIQRPFDYWSVLDQMAKLKRTGSGAGAGTTLTTSFTSDSLAYGFLKGGTAHLKDFQNQADGQGNYGILNPTIASAQLNEPKHQLILNGLFGSDPKTDSHAVLVGGMDMTRQTTWMPTQLIINALPTSGPGSAGDVSVNVRGHLSNVVQITEWRGKFTVTQRRNGGERIVTTYNAHLRAVLNSLRSAPGPAPTGGGQVGIQGATDTTCSYDASGQQDLTSDLETISRAGPPDIPYDLGDPANPNRTCSFGIGLDFTSNPPKMSAGAYANVGDGGGILVTHVYKPTGKTDTSIVTLFVSFATDYTGKLDAGYNIVAGKWSPNGDLTMEWGNIPAVSPPDPAAARSARPTRASRLRR
jgi:hypothetical protein